MSNASIQISIRLPRQLHADLECQAERDRRSVPGLARLLIEDGVQGRIQDI